VYRWRLFVEHDLGGSSGSAVDAARRAGYPYSEQMNRKMLRNAEKRGVHTARNGPSERERRGPPFLAPGKRGWPPTSSWPLFSRPTSLAAGRKLGSFSGSIPPYFVLSHNMPMIYTTSNWLRFGAFLSPLAPSLRIHWPQFSRHSPLATRHYLLRPYPAGYCLPPTANSQRPNGARSRRASPLSHYAPNQAIPADKSRVLADLQRVAQAMTCDHGRETVVRTGEAPSLGREADRIALTGEVRGSPV